MLTRSTSSLVVASHMRTCARRERGVVMVVALVILVVMTLAGLGLMRSMDTTTLIAGNMAFKQAATNSADVGVEQAVAWLEGNSANLTTDHAEVGYKATTANNLDFKNDSNSSKGGEGFWNYYKASGVCYYPMAGGVCSDGNTLDAAGNQISFMIQRLCPSQNSTTGCSLEQGATSSSGSSEGSDDTGVTSTAYGIYYRITVKVVGPRNAVSYVQAVVSM